MKRKIISLVLSVITILSVCSIFVVSTYAATYDKDTGYYSTWTKTISALGKNTKVGSLKKSFPTKKYSKAAILTKDANGEKSTVNSMNLWVMNSKEEWASEKYLAYPTGNKCIIYYYTGVTFSKDSLVYLWGEQGNVLSKTAVIKYWAY